MDPAQILLHIYLYWPGAMANMAPVILKPVFPWLDMPVDAGLRFRGRRLLGNHKTIRGFVLGISLAIITVYLQRIGPAQWQLVSYELWWLIGLSLGLGALGGDAIKSFFKRQTGIPPGKNWFPFDQLDCVIGSILALSWLYWPGFAMVGTLLLIGLALHLIIKGIGKALGFA
ncbi:CDP-archaeol synthase [Candidatus Woesearchaeota archaeon]|nr:CDP-archaeol synthase [Candidatus Woesearchaeota archaeon]